MPTKQAAAPTISFKAKLFKIGSWTILKLSEGASTKLPSRGQVMVKGSFNGVDFQTALEPDGKWGHWFSPDADLLKDAKASVGDTVSLTIQATKDWPEPGVPQDWQKALAADAEAQTLWERVTPMARWEWIRWARATNNSETRDKRIKVGISKLKSGERRPCCWNRNLCTVPEVSKSGILLDPA